MEQCLVIMKQPSLLGTFYDVRDLSHPHPAAILGRLIVSGVGEPNTVSVLVAKEHRGKGLGKALYQAALRDHGRLWTSWASHSDDARRVWISLMRQYQYKFVKSKLFVYNQPLDRPSRIPKQFPRRAS